MHMMCIVCIYKENMSIFIESYFLYSVVFGVILIAIQLDYNNNAAR